MSDKIVPKTGTKVRVRGLSWLGGRLYKAGSIVEWKEEWGHIPRGAEIVDGAVRKSVSVPDDVKLEDPRPKGRKG